MCGLPACEDGKFSCRWDGSDPGPADSFGGVVMIAIFVFCAAGLGATFFVGGKTDNYFVAGRTLSLPICTLTLASQCIDSNAVLGNADLSYKFHYSDGAVLPIGLGLSLIINGIFLARHMNDENLLTLPDLWGRRYGPAVEVLGGLITIVSFMALLAGNLVGCGTVLSYTMGMSMTGAICISGLIMFLYTAGGGLFSVAYSDILQSTLGITGVLVTGIWAINHGKNAPPPSIGFPGVDGIHGGYMCGETRARARARQRLARRHTTAARPRRLFSPSASARRGARRDDTRPRVTLAPSPSRARRDPRAREGTRTTRPPPCTTACLARPTTRTRCATTRPSGARTTTTASPTTARTRSATCRSSLAARSAGRTTWATR